MLDGLEIDFLLGEGLRSKVVHLRVTLSASGVLDVGQSVCYSLLLESLFFEGHGFSFKRLLELCGLRVKSVVVSPFLLESVHLVASKSDGADKRAHLENSNFTVHSLLSGVSTQTHLPELEAHDGGHEG